MKTRLFVICVVLGVVWCSAPTVEAGPSLPVTKPPVQPVLLLTGPPGDPTAAQGQWFIDLTTGEESVRPHEFYDEPQGGPMGPMAIEGHVDGITYAAGPGSPITAFSILATIHNDTSLDAQWRQGDNSHGESLAYLELPYVGPLVDTKLTAEFAIVDLNTLPLFFQPPYRMTEPFIEAVNEDQAGWYCWSPEDPNPDHQPPGGYLVPTWDFGTIPLMQSASRQLQFVVNAPFLQPFDPRYVAIETSFATQADILLNRSTSLKISTWIDNIDLDLGVALEEFPLRGSDVSVFHRLEIEEEPLDFGDAPDPTYPTLLTNDGARHIIVPGVFMGLVIDPEPDGQPDPTATGDDLANLLDEDGVTFTTPLTIGAVASVDIVCSTNGFLSAWIDFNASGGWNDPGEQVFSAQAVSTGTNSLAFNIPTVAVAGPTFARFRFTTLQAPILSTGLVLDGEVEDVLITLTEEEEDIHDFGDAPGPYPTLLVNNGARHLIVPGVHLGFGIDAEPDGQPSLNSDGDDLNLMYPGIAFPPGDEDGVSIPAVLIAGAVTQVQVVASVSGFLNAWIDWSANGLWIEPGEHVYINQPLAAGVNLLPLTVPVPPQLVPGGPHSRWRFTTYSVAGPSFTGLESDGEVEDYEVFLQIYDFGDAPAPYPTLFGQDGARHGMPSGYWLGPTPTDHEPDGQPDPQARGDDTIGAPDEDGVIPGGPMIRGTNVTLMVQASTSGGYLNAWVDFDQNGSWLDTGEQVCSDLLLGIGPNIVTVAVPATAELGQTFGRFRYSTLKGLAPTGTAPNGDVEDHAVTIYQREPAVPLVITNLFHTATTDDMTVEWAGQVAVTYEAEYTTMDLAATNVAWTPWGGYVTNAPYRQTDTTPAETTKFYRVIAPYAVP